MILHDKVAVLRRERIGKDEYGTPIYGDVEIASPAEVRPLTSDEATDTTGIVTTRYRVFLPPSADELTSVDAIRWRGRDYEVMGDYEPHLVGGRLHHIEVVVRRRG